MPQPGTTWDLKAAAELPTAQEDQSKWLAIHNTKETTHNETKPECPSTMQDKTITTITTEWPPEGQNYKQRKPN